MSNQFPPPQQGPQGGRYPNPHVNPQTGLPAYTGPQEPGYGFAPHPQTMPGVVRAAQIVLWVLGGLGVVAIVAAGALGGAELAGAVTFAYIFFFVSAGFAFQFGTAGNGARVTCIVLMSVEILVALGTVSRGGGGALLALAAAIAVIVLLSQGAAGAWFKRPRA
ncbi:hypothetical protein AB0O76_42600 [Streptomyces sp. NPDC086554]|uniref:hypothetical protein n=1 Tax=Streptomyces sp. NPDC086554 TaxID=3154864 RepID=UPI00343F10F4